MHDDEIYQLCDNAAQRLVESLPDEKIETLDEEARERLIVRLQDDLFEALREVIPAPAE